MKRVSLPRLFVSGLLLIGSSLYAQTRTDITFTISRPLTPGGISALRLRCEKDAEKCSVERLLNDVVLNSSSVAREQVSSAVAQIESSSKKSSTREVARDSAHGLDWYLRQGNREIRGEHDTYPPEVAKLDGLLSHVVGW